MLARTESGLGVSGGRIYAKARSRATTPASGPRSSEAVSGRLPDHVRSVATRTTCHPCCRTYTTPWSTTGRRDDRADRHVAMKSTRTCPGKSPNAGAKASWFSAPVRVQHFHAVLLREASVWNSQAERTGCRVDGVEPAVEVAEDGEVTGEGRARRKMYAFASKMQRSRPVFRIAAP